MISKQRQTISKKDSCKTEPVNTIWLQLKTKVNDMLQKYVPQKTLRQKWDVPWMTPEIKRLIRKKHRVYKLYQKYKKSSHWEQFKQLRKTVQRSMQKAKNDYFMSLLDGRTSQNCDSSNVNVNPSTGKRFWTHVKSVRRDSCGVATLNVDGEEISFSKDKA